MIGKALDGRYIIFDNHMHLNTSGRFLEAVDMFLSAGGTSFNLVNLPDFELSTEGYYEKIYEKTLSMASIIQRERGFTVPVTLGPYPLDYFKFKDAGIDPVYALKRGIDLACDFIEERKANAIGEIGRPHFEVPEEVLHHSNEVIEYGMKRAAEIGCPVILHTDDLDQAGFKMLENMARSSGIDLAMVVKHHALAENMPIDTGIRKSILASRSNVRSAIRSGNPFLLETDYVDDISMGWKVIPPDSVPKRVQMMRAEFTDWRSVFEKSFHELPLELYGEEMFRQFI